MNDQAQSSEHVYPVLERVLRKYFRDEEASATFVKRYHTEGEDSFEFQGFLAELKAAINDRANATLVVERALGGSWAPDVVEDQFIDLHDELLQQGPYGTGPSHDGDDDEDESHSPDQALIDHYATRKISLPQAVGGRDVPLWALPSAGLAVMGVGVLGHSLLSSLGAPDILVSACTFIAALGIFPLVVGALAMTSLRNEKVRDRRESPNNEDRKPSGWLKFK